MNNSELLKTLENQNSELLAFTEKIAQQPIKSLTTKPSETAWSVLECFDHMNTATELYLDQIEGKLKELRPEEKQVYKKTLFAGIFTKQLAPTEEGIIKSKMKTMKVFYPKANLNLQVVDRFKHNLTRFQNVLSQCKGKNLRSFKVTTALGPILKFHLGDALDFVHAHNRRHALQIENTLEELGKISTEV